MNVDRLRVIKLQVNHIVRVAEREKESERAKERKKRKESKNIEKHRKTAVVK